MKITILGGGITGLSAAYYLAKAGHEVTIIEKGEKVGGLARGFGRENWEWDLERTYHHIFSNDHAILTLANEIGFDKFIFSAPKTASLFGEIDNYRIYPVDSPKDFLLLPELSLISKFRAGITLVFLKASPFLKLFESITSADFLQKTMGAEVWTKLWEQLFRKKYGKYAGNILASFIWARITKRTQSLGYPTGGFQSFVDALEKKDKECGVKFLTATSVEEVEKKGEGFEISLSSKGSSEREVLSCERILSTLPYPITLRTMGGVLGSHYVGEQSKRKYLFAINLIIKTSKPLLKDTYWLNVGAKDIPIMCIVQHTNFVSPSHYGGDNITYIAWYVDVSSELLKMEGEEILAFVTPHLRAISPDFAGTPEIVGLFKAPFAQPIFDAEFITIPRTFATATKNVYVANMDMTYPYDRGTNYAVQLGKDVSNYIITL